MLRKNDCQSSGLVQRLAKSSIRGKRKFGTQTLNASSARKSLAHESSIYTIGHSTRTIESFIEILNAYKIKAVVDIRTIPRSRHNPQFNKDVLPESLKAAKIKYHHMPKLGGLRRALPDSVNKAWRNSSFRGYADYMQVDEFESALDELIGLSKRRRIVLMCAEAVPWRCHRSLISDALFVRKIQTTHILSAVASKKHVLTPWAKVKGKNITYPEPASLGQPSAFPPADLDPISS